MTLKITTYLQLCFDYHVRDLAGRLDLAPRLSALPSLPGPWPAQTLGGCSLLPCQPRGEGVTGGCGWAGAVEDCAPAADSLDGHVIGKNRPWFRGWGWILICSLLRLATGNGVSCRRRAAPRAFLGKSALSRVCPGSSLWSVIQRPQFTVWNVIQRWESSKSCSEASQMDRCRQTRNLRLSCQLQTSKPSRVFY